MNDRETVRRALHQLYGNVTTAERERLEACDRECWLAQANGGAGWQRTAAEEMAQAIAETVEAMPAHRVTQIADYIGGDGRP